MSGRLRFAVLGLALGLGVTGCGDTQSAAAEPAAVEEGDSGQAQSALTGPVPTGTVLVARYNTYMRRGPASSYSPILIVPAGGRVAVLRSTPSGYYYYVRYGGRDGWVYGPYFDVEAPTQPQQPTTPTKPVVVELRADTNRDGVVSLTDSGDFDGKGTWTAARGAIFLANIDDDTLRCSPTTTSGVPLPDSELPRCNDAADELVNGADDLLDLARLKVAPWADAPSDAVGRISLSPGTAPVRLFRKVGSNFSVFRPGTDTLSASELRAGVELAIEGKDVVRDAAVWNGLVSVSLRVTAQANAAAGFPQAVDRSDSVAMKVAPFLLFHHGTPVEQLYATYISGDAESYDYVYAVHGALLSSAANGLLIFRVQDQWTQDFFETGYMSMPATSGRQQVIRVNLRSANVYSNSSSYPLREAGRLVFTALRGRDSAGLQQWDPGHDPTGMQDTLDSYGNTETIPPFSHNGVSYPFGRILRGSIPSFKPDPSVTKLLESQGAQPLVTVDTSWLLVGHVDETISFHPASTPRGWVALVNDPALARQMLQAEVSAGRGSNKLFAGKRWLGDFGEYSAEVTVSQVLADTEVMTESARAASAINAQVNILKSVTGLTDAEIVRVPFLHYPASGYSLAYQPGTVNGVSVNPGNFIAPDPFGPVVGGKDIFKTQLEQVLATRGVTVRWVDDWNLYHRLSGEVHCGSNAARVIPSSWWENLR